MHILQKLRFGGRWVTAQKDVNFPAESSSPRLRKLLGAAPEKLAKDAFLDIREFPDRWGEGVNELLSELRVLGKVFELLDLPLIESCLVVIFQKLILDRSFILDIVHLLVISVLLVSVHVESALVSSDEVDHIDVCPVYVLEHPLARVDSHSDSLVDSHSLDAVTGLHKVNQVFVGAQMHCVRGLTFGDRLRCLLQLDMLLVGEEARVVHHLERVALLTVVAEVRLEDASSLDELILCKPAVHTFECSFLHFGDDVAVTDDDALNRDELVNVRGVEISDSVLGTEVEGAHLDDGIVGAVVLGHVLRVPDPSGVSTLPHSEE